MLHQLPFVRSAARLALVVSMSAVLSQTAAAAENAMPHADQLLPKTTVAAVFVPDVRELESHWEKTRIGTLLRDPVMEPFRDDLQRQFQDRWLKIERKFGLKLEDIRGIAGGEVALALVRQSETEAATVALIDVTGHQPQVNQVLQKARAHLKQKGARSEEHAIEDTKVIVFHLPPDEGETEGGTAVYFVSGNLLGVADDLGVIQAILGRYFGKKTAALVDVTSYAYTKGRCDRAVNGRTPQLRWFIDPVGYAEVRALSEKSEGGEDAGKEASAEETVAAMKRQGFDAIQGVGGNVDFAIQAYENFHHTAVYAPRPYKTAAWPYEDAVPMEVFDFPNETDFTPPSWVPEDIAACTVFYWDIAKAFKNFGPLFDELYAKDVEYKKGKKEEGIWNEALDSWANEPKGPKIDIEKELVGHLGKRVIILTDYRLPITTTSQRTLYAIEAKNAKAVAAGIDKLFGNDPTYRSREIDGLKIWESVEKKRGRGPRVDVGGPSTSFGIDEDELEEDEEADEKVFPDNAVTVFDGYLLIASHTDILLKALARKVLGEGEPLAKSIDYRIVASTIKSLSPPPRCMQTFVRTDEEYRSTYELIRLGKMPESNSLVARLLNVLLPPEEGRDLREQRIDGKELPEYQVVRRYLGPAARMVVTEKDGWLEFGFTLSK